MEPILVDTGIWIDHLHQAEPELQRLLVNGQAVTHPVVVGELACGSIKKRKHFLSSLKYLPSLPEVSSGECLYFLEENKLWGRGLGWGDMHLLAACRLGENTIWTRDKPLCAAAGEVGIPVRDEF